MFEMFCIYHGYFPSSDPAAESDFDPAHGPRTKACSFKSLSELLRDNGSIPYLLQFMETRGMQHLLRFWLESDMFQRSSQVLRQGQARRPLLRPSDRKCYSYIFFYLNVGSLQAHLRNAKERFSRFVLVCFFFFSSTSGPTQSL